MKDYFDFLRDLGIRESSGRYSTVNQHGYLGEFQMGKLAMIDAGLYRLSPNENGWDNRNYNDSGWTSYAEELGVSNVSDFLENREAQAIAIENYHKKAWGYIVHEGLDKYIGQTIDGIEITKSGLLAGYHLKGMGNTEKGANKRYGIRDWLEDGVDNDDGNGTAVSSYVKKFAGYELEFDNNNDDARGSADDAFANPEPPITSEDLLEGGSADDAFANPEPPITSEDLLEGGSADDAFANPEPPITQEDLLAGGSPDDAIANPEPPEPSLIESVSDTLEDIGDAVVDTLGDIGDTLEDAWKQNGVQSVGAGASAAFMTYARLNGWTEESWLDESWEQGVASFAVTEVAKDIADFNFDANDYNLFEWSTQNAQGQTTAGAGATMVASLLASELADELGLGGTDVASAKNLPFAPQRLYFSVHKPFKVDRWSEAETPRLGRLMGDSQAVAVRQGQATAPLDAVV